jgi:hypothetical protein
LLLGSIPVDIVLVGDWFEKDGVGGRRPVALREHQRHPTGKCTVELIFCISFWNLAPSGTRGLAGIENDNVKIFQNLRKQLIIFTIHQLLNGYFRSFFIRAFFQQV